MRLKTLQTPRSPGWSFNRHLPIKPGLILSPRLLNCSRGQWLPLLLMALLAAGCDRPPATAADALAAALPDTGADIPAELRSVRFGDWGVDLSQRDLSVAPGDDFFRHVNGRWLESYELPPDKTSFGTFNALFELSQERVQALIEELAAMNPSRGSVEQKVGDYYASYLDTTRIDALGVEPVADWLEAIAAIETLTDLARAFGRADIEGSNAPIRVGIEIDRMDPTRFIAGIDHSGLGLPERDYYLEETGRFADIREQYRAHIARMLRFADVPDAESAAARILELETRIAAAHWPRGDRRNRDLTYNLRALTDLEKDHPGFPWRDCLSAAGFIPDELNVRVPSAIAPLVEIVRTTPIETWRAYLAYHLLSNNAPYLAADIDEENFSFYGRVVYGQPEQRERWRRAISLVSASNGLGDAIGQVYVARYFPESSKTQVLELVGYLRQALRARIEALDWMSGQTKLEAYRKLEGFLPNIGYPDRWRDYSQVRIDREDLMGNVRRLRAYYEQDAIERLGEPTDRTEWFTTAQMVNAFYTPQFNAITFPAGILEAPFFDPTADAAVNFGAIGAVIGHEMGHGFDDQGSKSDEHGVQRNWWQPEDRIRFEERAARLAAQYSAYEPVPGTFVDGTFTLGENIGDLGGLAMAYHAYRLSLDGREPPLRDGLTGDQRFFLAFGQLWRAVIREETLVARLKSDSHAPNEYRVNGAVRNFDPWYQAFDVGPDHALYLPPEERVRIW